MNTLHLVCRDIVDLTPHIQAVNSTNAGHCLSLPFNLYVCRRKKANIVEFTWTETNQLRRAERKLCNRCAGCIFPLGDWSHCWFTPNGPANAMAASMIFAMGDSRFPTQPELLVGFATRDSRANVNWRNVVHIRSVARKESIDNTKNIKTYPSLSINLLFTCKYIRMNHFVEHLIIRWVYLKDCDKDFEKPVLSHFLAGALSAD